jgi:hypothetical protein
MATTFKVNGVERPNIHLRARMLLEAPRGICIL